MGINIASGLAPVEDSLRFRTGAAMLTRLGSEQLKDEITAVIELVKNSYDADANYVLMELRTASDDQRLIIQDDGTGMSRNDLRPIPLTSRDERWGWFSLASFP